LLERLNRLPPRYAPVQSFSSPHSTRSRFLAGSEISSREAAISLLLNAPLQSGGFADSLIEFWGEGYGEVEDPFVFVWAIATHLEDLTAKEIEARRKKVFAGGPPSLA
jgi:hypothetical protein